MRYHRTSVVGIALCLAVARAAQADPTPPFHFFSTDQTRTNSSGPFDNGSGIVGWGSADILGNFDEASAPTINFNTGAGWTTDLYVYNGSTVNIRGGVAAPTIQPGGIVYGVLSVYDNSKVNISEMGSAPYVSLHDQSQLTLTGAGAIGMNTGQSNGTGLTATGSSSITISGGSIYQLFAVGSTTITMSSGAVGSLNSEGAGSSVSIAGGSVASAAVSNGATMNIFGGDFIDVDSGNGSSVSYSGHATGTLDAGGGSLDFNGGSAAALLSQLPNALLIMGDGSVSGNVEADQSGIIYLNGGSIGGGLSATTQGAISVSVTVTGGASEDHAQLFLNSGASIGGDVTATDGQVLVQGGIIEGNLITHGAATVQMDGKSLSAQLYDNSVITLNSGTISSVETHNFSNFVMVGGAIGGLLSRDSSQGTITGGSIGGMSIHNFSVVTLGGSTSVNGDIITYDASQVIIGSDVIVVGDLVANNSSTISFSGTLLGDFEVHNNATIIWGGGVITATSPPGPQISRVGAATSSSSTSPSIHIYDNGNLIIRGVHLSSLLLDGNNTDGTNTYSLYQLSGFLGDGSTLSSNIQLYVQHPTASFTTGGAFQFAPADQIWNAAASGSWATGTNWLPAIAPGDPGSSVVFNDPGTGIPIVIALDGDHSMGTFTITGTYTFNQGSAGTLFLNNNGGQVEFLTGGGAVTINAPVAAQDSTLVNVQDTALTLTAGITVSAGKTLAVGGDSPLQTAFIRGGTLSILGGSVRMIPNGTPASLSRVENLVILDQSILDLTNNDMIVTASSAAAILTLLQTQYKIMSSTATPGMGVGMLSGAQYLALHPGATFDGAAVAGTDVLLKYAPLGDGDLDGRISMDDYLLIDEGYASQGANPSWIDGDFNYDGAVDGLDYVLIDFSYMQQAGTEAAGEISAHAAEFGEAYVNALDRLGVPEPGSLAIMAGGAAILLRRRRR